MSNSEGELAKIWLKIQSLADADPQTSQKSRFLPFLQREIITIFAHGKTEI